MVRIPRIVYQGCPFHVTHRGNRREPVFFDTDSRLRYVGLLRAYGERFGLRIWAYCLMPNHVHLIVFAERLDSMARAIGIAHRRYSRWVNERREWTGHLWENRFYSTPLDDLHLWVAVRYVELNPVRSGLADRPELYPWSSARAHALGAPDPLLAGGRPFPGLVHDWSAWLLRGMGDPVLDRIRANTSTGRPSFLGCRGSATPSRDSGQGG